MQTSGDQRREIANAYSVVITRLVRNCALGRVIQYSRDSSDRTIGRSVLDPRLRGDDGGVRVASSTSLRAQRSNPLSPRARKDGLLRCARNDAEKAGDHLARTLRRP